MMLESGMNARVVYAGWGHHGRIGAAVWRGRVARRGDAHWMVAWMHHVRWGVWIAFRWDGQVAPGHDARVGTGGGKLEGLCDFVLRGVDVDALAGEYGVEVIDSEAGVMSAQKSLGLEDLPLELLDMATGGERLAVSVLLVALHAGGCAGGASWML